ncbi:MAG: tetratricopeptide repeat protein [Candidatus Thiodiazotropha taylori]
MVVGYRVYLWLAVFLLTSTAWGTEPTTPESEKSPDAGALLQAAWDIKRNHEDLYDGTVGLFVLEVLSDTQAEKIGLQMGDVILRYDGHAPVSVQALIQMQGEVPENNKVKLEYLRIKERNIVELKQGRIGARLAPMDSPVNGLEAIAMTYHAYGKYNEAIEYFLKTLAKHKETGDRGGEGRAQYNIGVVYRNLEQYPKALEYFEQALVIKQKIDDPDGTVDALRNIAILYKNLEQYPKALECYERALVIVQEIDNPDIVGTIFFEIGNLYKTLRQYTKALEYFEQALVIKQEIGDRNSELDALYNIAISYNYLGQYTKALEYFERVLVFTQEMGDRDSEGLVLSHIGEIYYYLAQYPKALVFYERALDIKRDIDDRYGERQILTGLGSVYRRLSHYSKAMEYHEQALVTAKDIGDRVGEGSALGNLGMVYSDLKQYQKAFEYSEQAFEIFRKAGNLQDEGRMLNSIGSMYSRMYEYSEAIENHKKALMIAREIGDRVGEEQALGNLGLNHVFLGQYSKALKYHEQALVITREMGNRADEGIVLASIASLYGYLNQYQKALEYYEQSLNISRDIGDMDAEGSRLSFIGVLYDKQGEYTKALDYYEKSLVIAQNSRNRESESSVLNHIGILYHHLGQYHKALGYYEKSLVIDQEIGNRDGEAAVLGNIGFTYDELGQYLKALVYTKQALIIISTIDLPGHLYKVWGNLSGIFAKLDQIEAAILAGKQAVNVIQTIRAGNTSLDKELQQSFLTDKKDAYRDLADLLIKQGRIPEAEQVLAMLKEEEYFDFIRRDNESDNRSTRASHTPAEQAWLEHYQRFSDRLVTLGKEYTALEQRKSLNEDEQRRLAELEKELDTAQVAFLEVVGGLSDHFKQVSTDKAESHGKRQLDLLENQQERLAELGHGAVLIHTVTTDDKLHLLLTTPESQLARLSPIGETELNTLIQRFRGALQSPSVDPLPLAHELYRYLVKPLEKDLQQAGAKTLMWSLDGALRYIPLAALHDGERYLLERYPLVLYTAAAAVNLGRDNNSTWRLAGLGVSKEHRDFTALEAVPGELNGIILENEQDTDGVIPGQVYLNDAFNKESFKQVLRDGYPALHIASHFRLQPGNSQTSHLLLGDGDVLSLEEFRKKRAYKLRNVDLLTLSACNTAIGDSGDGREVESFGVLAQQRGAAGVLATLWKVADKSTGIFMQELYRLRSQNPEMTKAEALRQAQLAMIKGQYQGEGGAARGFKRDEQVATSKEFQGYTHPFYWAPFILMGNWL